MARDRWGALGSIGSCEMFFAITTHDTNELVEVIRGLYVGIAGNVRVGRIDGTNVDFTNVPAGTILPVRALYVRASGTSAGNLIGMA